MNDNDNDNDNDKGDLPASRGIERHQELLSSCCHVSRDSIM